MALLQSNDVELGTPAPDFDLPATDGESYGLTDFSEAEVLVVMFICNHCPYVKAVRGRLVDLAEEMADEPVAFAAINPNDADQYPEDDFESMREVAEDHDFPFPYLRDESQEVAKAYGAVCTPDIFVYDEDRKLAYRGRIDDNWKEPENVKRRDLYEAIRTLLQGGRPDPDEQVPSQGCSIKWKAE